MSRNVLIALLLIIVSVLVMIFNNGPVSVDLLFTTVRAYAGLAYLSFTVVGVVIGVLLK